MDSKSLVKQVEDYAIQNKESHYRLAYSYVKNADDALDVVQESIYKAFSSIGTLKSPDYIKTWFYKIIVNTSISLLRKRNKLVFIDEEALHGLDKGETDKYEDIDLHNALDDLPAKYRIIVILKFFEDFKLDDIAAILDENVNTVKTRLYKALKMLSIKIKDLEEREGYLL